MTLINQVVSVLQEWVDDAIGDFFLIHSTDLPGQAKFLRRIEGQITELSAVDESSEMVENATTLLQRAADQLKKSIFDEVGESAAALAEVAETLEEIRRLSGGHIHGASSPVEEPDDVTPQDGPVTSKAAANQADGESFSWVDDSIVAAYIEQQLSVLPEIEQLVLTIEKMGDAESMHHFRRMIHTMKGESGIVGALHIEQVCHQMEDYLETAAEGIESDRLLAALDWIERNVRELGEGGGDASNQEIVQLLSGENAPIQAEPSLDSLEIGAEDGSREIDAEATSVPIGDIELALDFVAESQEHFDAADENLLLLEKNGRDPDAISAVFRVFHTIKGVAGFLGLPPIGDLAHIAETLLDEVRKGRRAFEGVLDEVVFDALDMLKVMVNDLSVAAMCQGPFQIRPDYPKLMAALRAVQNASSEEEEDELPDAPSVAEIDLSTESPPVIKQEKTSESRSSAQATSTGATQTMKVDAARIDLLLDIIGELVIAESIVSGEPEIRALKSLRVEKSLSLLGKITRSLQDMGMSMRLVPLDPMFRKMGRLVRDLSKKSGKQVELVIEGGDTEMDKSMVEKLGDPLVHMIRNSMDHGIETGEQREKQGKPVAARIILRAYHQGGNIHIDIDDDGRGLNREAIAKKAIERGLIKTADGMSDQEIFSLIFQPGFSTAEKVTEISGRGVGMDVVRRNIESLRGNVLIRSTPGVGSVFTLSLPLTTAIIDGMLARVGEEVYILPTLSILESYRPSSGQIHTVSGKGEVVSFRGNLLPLHRLSRLLGVSGAENDPFQAIVIVVEEFGKYWGLMVDEILGQQQVVIKSLGDGVGQVPGIAGASILADGRPGLILDVGEMIRVVSADKGSAGDNRE